MRLRQLTTLALLAGFLPAFASAQRGVQVRPEGRPGWLGIRCNITVLNNNGRINVTVGVGEVVDGSPAQRMGLKPGDKIVRIDGKTIAGDNCDAIARGLEAGDTVHLRVQSGEREHDVTIIAAARPAEFTIAVRPFDREFMLPGDTTFRRMVLTMMDTTFVGGDTLFLHKFGMLRRGMRLDSAMGGAIFFGDTVPGRRMTMRFRPSFDEPVGFERFEMVGQRSVAGAAFLEMKPGLAQYFNTDRGLLLTDVSPGTPAFRAGLEPGDVLLRIDGQSVETVDDVRDLVRRSTRPLKLEVMRKGRTRAIELDARANVRR